MSESLTEETSAERFASYIEDLKAEGKNVDLVQTEGVATSLDDIARIIGCEKDQLHKTVCLNYKDQRGVRHLVAVVVPAAGRVDMEKVGKGLDVTAKVKSAQPEFITEETGFVPGGIPPIGFDAQRLVDERTFNQEVIFAGGGNNLNTYTRMDPALLKELYPEIIVGDFLQA